MDRSKNTYIDTGPKVYYLDTGAGVTVAPTPYAHLQVCVLSKPLQYLNGTDRESY